MDKSAVGHALRRMRRVDELVDEALGEVEVVDGVHVGGAVEVETLEGEVKVGIVIVELEVAVEGGAEGTRVGIAHHPGTTDGDSLTDVADVENARRKGDDVARNGCVVGINHGVGAIVGRRDGIVGEDSHGRLGLGKHQKAHKEAKEYVFFHVK